MAELLARKDVPVTSTWNLTDLFETVADWEAACREIEALTVRMTSYEGKLNDKKALRETLDTQTKVGNLLSRVYCYSFQSLDCDTANSELQARHGKSQSLSVKLETACAYIAPELLAAPEGYLDSLKGDPAFADYDMMIDDLLRNRAHTLSPEMEKLVAETGEMREAPHNFYESFTTADLEFPMVKNDAGEKIRLTHSNYIPLMTSRSRAVRQGAFKAMYGTFKKYENTVASAYKASVDGDVFYARAARHESALAHKLFPDAVPTEVYDALIESVRRHLPGLDRLVCQNARLNGISKRSLSMADVYLPPQLGFQLDLPYDEAYALMTDCLSVLGEDYQAVLRRAKAERWLDPFENLNKRSGAYSIACYGYHPYVLLNYHPDLDHLLTIAHEMGHSMHSYYSNAAQPCAKADYSLFVAEVASTVNEVLVLMELMDRHKEGEAYLLYMLLDGFRTTLFRQTMFAEFERESHRMAEAGEPLTSETLCAAYAKLNEQYYASAKQTDLIRYEWMRIPHFYRSFYVYKYATGFSAAMAIAAKIRKEGAPMVAKYKKFLSAGGSLYPLDALKLADIDMTRGEPVEAALCEFDRLLLRYEKVTEIK